MKSTSLGATGVGLSQMLRESPMRIAAVICLLISVTGCTDTSPSAPGPESSLPADYQDLVAQSIEELRLKTDAHHRLWHLGEADWHVDQDTGQIVFSASNGMVATCSVQIIGSFNTDNATWLWAWDNPSVQPELRKHAVRLREYGASKGISELTTRKLSTTEDKCWEFTALACKLNDAQGGYRGPSGPMLIFMTFGQPQLSGTSTGAVSTAVESAADKPPGEFTSEIPADVRATLTGFIAALHNWEVEAWQATEADGSMETRKAVQANYQALIRRWCVADVKPQPAAYGSEPDHDPETERFVSAAVSEFECWVRTQHTDPDGSTADYEYHLRREDGKWLVENLFYVRDGSKYECL